MKKNSRKFQYSKLIVSTVVLLYFILIPYSLVYIWRFEANAVLITILSTVGGIVAVVCNGYMNKSRFENVIKIQKTLDKAAASTDTISNEIRAAVREELKKTLTEDFAKISEIKEDVKEEAKESFEEKIKPMELLSPRQDK